MYRNVRNQTKRMMRAIWHSCKVCKSDGTGCSAAIPFGLYGQNTCDIYQPTGEKFCLNLNETVAGQNLFNGVPEWATWINSPQPEYPTENSMSAHQGVVLAVDNVTGFVLVDGDSLRPRWRVPAHQRPQFHPEPVVANMAKNGIVICCPADGNQSMFPSPILRAERSLHRRHKHKREIQSTISARSWSWEEKHTLMSLLTGGSAPALWSMDVTERYDELTSQPLTGVSANIPGGSAITVFDSLGVGLVTSFGNNIADSLQRNHTEAKHRIALPGVPVSAVADTANGIAVIGNADQPNAGGTLTEVNPVTGTTTLVPSVETPVLPTGTVPATTGKGFFVCPQDGVSACSSYTLP